MSDQWKPEKFIRIQTVVNKKISELQKTLKNSKGGLKYKSKRLFVEDIADMLIKQLEKAVSEQKVKKQSQRITVRLSKIRFKLLSKLVSEATDEFGDPIYKNGVSEAMNDKMKDVIRDHEGKKGKKL
jgi:hypothetical protein